MTLAAFGAEFWLLHPLLPSTDAPETTKGIANVEQIEGEVARVLALCHTNASAAGISFHAPTLEQFRLFDASPDGEEMIK